MDCEQVAATTDHSLARLALCLIPTTPQVSISVRNATSTDRVSKLAVQTGSRKLLRPGLGTIGQSSVTQHFSS